MKQYTINIYSELGSKSADDDKKGDIIYKNIKQIIDEKGGGEIILDFENIDLLNTAFLNNAIGRLYSLDDWIKLNFSIKIRNFPKDAFDLIKEVIESARERYLYKDK